MKGKIYKYCLFSYILINFWTLYGFFDYYLDMQTTAWFHGVGLFFFYFESLFAAIGFGLILLIIRLILHLRNKKNILKSNFFYVLSMTFNLNLLMVTIISVVLEMLKLDTYILSYLFGLIIVTSIISFDIYRLNFGVNKKPTA